MKTIETMLKVELGQLQNIIKETNKRLQKVPKGRLRISNKKTHREYYYISDGEKQSGRYLKVKERALAEKIAQRDYDRLLLKGVSERKKIIERFLKVYSKNGINSVYDNTNPYRKELLKNIYISDSEYVRQWERVEYEGKHILENMQVFVTEKGERVRSKSEKIIADKLYMMGIPYRYEYPLILNNGAMVYPDFTILRMPERKEVYLEHFGMMDDINYVDTTLFKIHSYEMNDIYLGINLFVTYETSSKPLNTKKLNEMFKLLFCSE